MTHTAATTQGFFITGTDTDVGKTLTAAWLMTHFGGTYWKPVQCGDLDSGGDTATVQHLTGLPPEQFIPPAFDLREPLSPHEAARRENRSLSLTALTMPQGHPPLWIEGAGGLMVPLNDHGDLIIDLIQKLGLPVILVARSQLGTINHTLLSLNALRARNITVRGIIMNGAPAPHNRTALEHFGQTPVLAEIPILPMVTPAHLRTITPSFSLFP